MNPIRSETTVTVNGTVHTIRATFDLLAALEAVADGPVSVFLKPEEAETGKQSRLARAAIAALTRASPPLTAKQAEAAVFDAGTLAYAIEEDGSLGLVPRLAFLLLYGPKTLGDYLAAEASGDAAGEAAPAGKKPGGTGMLSRGLRFLKRLRPWRWGRLTSGTPAQANSSSAGAAG